DELAREHSDRGKELIDLGFFHQGELPMEFDLVAFSMNVGEISPVFGSSVGYHIIKVTDKKPAAPIPFEEAKTEIHRRLQEERRAEKTRELVARLKEKAVIEDTSPDDADAVPQHAHAS